MTPDDGINRDELPEVCIVVNGPLGMGEGKAIGQAFQAALRMFFHIGSADPDTADDLASLWSAWKARGTRTIVKIADTPAMFERICREVPGYVMRDEGHTEVDAGAATLFISHPFLHKDRPKVLNNKKCQLL